MLRRDDPDFKKVVDDALSTVYRSGDIERIYAKWFRAPIPPSNVNLNVPMSASLKLAIEHLIDSGDPAAYRTESLTR
jgi:glutamate/aspartate transport system substrate-binding protein